MPTFTKNTLLIAYSGYLKTYFNASHDFDLVRVSLLESYDLQALKINDTLTNCILNGLCIFKGQFNHYKEFIDELEDITGVLGDCRIKKQHFRSQFTLKINQLKIS
jgi:hypothetical protein